jgi:UDP-N-acetylmuramoylalanine--D-glutamate ligase
MPVASMKIKGLHNASNALASLALGEALGLPMPAMLEELATFAGLPHRSQWVADVHGVTYINDSKGTNVGATVAALDGLAQKSVLIAGGDGKGQDFSPLAAPVSRWCRAVMLIGRDAPLLREALADTNVPLHDHATLEAATHAATRLAEPGDAVLLSPACASFDMFKSYVHRADAFRLAVTEIAAERGVAL